MERIIKIALILLGTAGECVSSQYEAATKDYLQKESNLRQKVTEIVENGTVINDKLNKLDAKISKLYKKAAIYEACRRIADKCKIREEIFAEDAMCAEAELAQMKGISLESLHGDHKDYNGVEELRENGDTAAKISYSISLYTVLALYEVAKVSKTYSNYAINALKTEKANKIVNEYANQVLKKLETKEKPVEIIKESSEPSTSHPTSSKKSDQ